MQPSLLGRRAGLKARFYDLGLVRPLQELAGGGRIANRGRLVTIRDWVAANSTRRTGIAGAKPEAFCRLLFSVFNAQAGDELVHLFPGSGIVSRTLQVVQAELATPPQPPDPTVEAQGGGTDD